MEEKGKKGGKKGKRNVNDRTEENKKKGRME